MDSSFVDDCFLSFKNFKKLARFDIFVWSADGLKLTKDQNLYDLPKNRQQDLSEEELRQIYEDMNYETHLRLRQHLAFGLANMKFYSSKENFNLNDLQELVNCRDINQIAEAWADLAPTGSVIYHKVI